MNMTNEIKGIADHYGLELQMRQLQEECGELIVAVNKVIRKGNLHKVALVPYIDNVVEEIADVEIMLTQVKYLMDCKAEVKEVKARKIQRQLRRINGEEE